MNGDLTCREAGRRGGQAILARLGPDHFRRIGALARRDPAEQRRRAIAGGATTRARHGAGFYEAIGRKGGEAVLARYGKAFYADIARRRHS